MRRIREPEWNWDNCLYHVYYGVYWNSCWKNIIYIKQFSVAFKSAARYSWVKAMDLGPFFAFLCLFIGELDGSISKERVKSSTLCYRKNDMSFYDFSMKDLDGNMISMEEFTGHVVLAVNVATFWGYTYQYYGLNALQESEGGNLDSCGLRIVGFPCNQFGFQEPGENKSEIMNGLKYVRPGHGFVPNFPLFEKRDVNGDKENKIYTFFKVSSGFFYIFCFIEHQKSNWDQLRVLLQIAPNCRASAHLLKESFSLS